MAERRTTYGMPDLLASGHEELLGPAGPNCRFLLSKCSTLAIQMPG